MQGILDTFTVSERPLKGKFLKLFRTVVPAERRHSIVICSFKGILMVFAL